jgi:GT2 family glycosyltransferase
LKAEEHENDFRKTTEAELPQWALVLCTYRRRDVLMLCLQAAMGQTRPPAEVIIVDASSDWQSTRDQVMAEIVPLCPGVRWQYVQAHRRSLPAQRNQGISLASAPILFMIDDDSMMYPDCAQEILRVYAADTENKIAGVGAAEVMHPHFDQPAPSEAAVGKSLPKALHRLRAAVRWNVAQLFDRGPTSFIPYEGKWADQPIPPTCAHLDLSTTRSLNGFRMTFRRDAIASGGFLGWFVGYAPLEDLDGSHRASRHGMLVNANRARLCHLTFRGGRPSHYSATAQWVMSGAVLHAVFGHDRQALARAWRRQVNRFLLLELAKDLAKGRLTLPAFRGILHGSKHLRQIYSMTPDELEAWYPQVQASLVGQSHNLLRAS